MNSKKITTIVISVLAVCMVLIGFFSVTYALFSVDAYGKNVNTYTTGILSIDTVAKSDVISLANTLPMSDDEGKQTVPYIFTIKNNGTVAYKFDIKLLSTGTNVFLPQYIKVQVDDGEVLTLSSLSNSVIKGDVTLNAGEHIDVTLRVWLSIDTPNSELGKTFNSEIVTTGEAVYTAPLDDTNYENFVLNYLNLETIGYTGAENEELVIPATFYDEQADVWYKVTEIDDQAFMYASNIASVTIPDSVVKIGSHAFSSLNKIESITIPSSVTFIDDSAFAYCDSLKVINVDDNNKNYVSIDGIMYTKDTKTLVQYPAGMTNESFSISNNVTRIGNASFGGAVNLKSITIPNTVTAIGDSAFYGSGLTSVVVPSSVTVIERAAFYRCSNLTDITIPNTVTTIGDDALSETAWLTAKRNANEMVIVGDNILYDGRYLSGDVVIPDNVKEIKNYAFFGNMFMTSITIPNTVLSIGEYAFSDCSKLSNVYYKGNETNWNSISFGEGNEPLLGANITYNYS